MADVLSCPAWCIEHWALDPTEPDNGVHYGPRMSVTVAGSAGTETSDQVVTQVIAFDVAGHRDTTIHLDKPSRGRVQLNSWQARATAVTLLYATDLHDARFLAGSSCPTWCVDDHDHTPPDAAIRHASLPQVVYADGPVPPDSAVSIQVLALDIADTRRVFLDLALPGSHTPLTVAEACKVASCLLDAADIYDTTR
ncbi:hypothetical protein [Nocardia noduli]|uniref:hypothetical protein n=1 Tax=Nocardia noduli TaxID=2815722 RepID=UPI001C246B5C|nr:hypothetical protein [Nocardia noduli]